MLQLLALAPMFSGIIEEVSSITRVIKGQQSLQITIKKPKGFEDLSVGDSIAVNGVCLTLEKFNENEMEFTLGHETLQVTTWTQELLLIRPVNLERSMKISQRIHGHFVLGHIDGLAQVIEKSWAGESLIFKIEIPNKYHCFVWPKGSITLNGVSLTINSVDVNRLSVCLIPETLRRTNLTHVEVGEFFTFEVDSMARAFVHLWQTKDIHAQF